MIEEFNDFTKNMMRNSPITLSFCESTEVSESNMVEGWTENVWLEEQTRRGLSGCLQFSKGLLVWFLWAKLELAGEATEKQSITSWQVRIS